MTQTDMNGAKSLWATLAAHGIHTVFGYPGGAIMPVYDALTFYPEVRHILARHEQGAIHAAEGWAKATGEIGVCLATSGPGATNLVTGLADAMLDSVPLLAITGNVARHLMGTDAFQEADITGITLPVTKHNYVVRDVEELPRVIAEAIRIARSGRPGPVLVDIPKDVQLAPYHGEVATPHARPEAPEPSAQAVERARELLMGAKKPVIMVGGGSVDAAREITALARAWDIPVITTLMGLGTFPSSDPLWLGMPGMHGSVAANRAISEADVLLGLGLRFDDRVTGRVNGFAPNASIIHVDLDAAEIGKIVRTHLPVRGDAGVVAALLTGGPRNWSGPSGARRSGSGSHAPRPRSTGARATPSRLWWTGCGPTTSSPPTWGSTRCSPRSSPALSGPGVGSTQVGWARWASAFRRRWAQVWPNRACGAS